MRINIVDLDDTLTKNFIKFCCVELNTYPDMITIKGRDEPTLKDNTVGLCYEVNCQHKYLIVVAKQNRSVTDIYTTLAQEMMQIKKFMKGEAVIEIEDSANIVKKYVDNLYNVV